MLLSFRPPSLANSGRQSRTAPPRSFEQAPFLHVGFDLQHPPPRVPHQLARQPIQLPPQRGHRRGTIGLGQHPSFQQLGQVVGSTPMAKYIALASNSPHGICSIPRPIFSSLCQFSHWPRLLCFQITSLAVSCRLVATA